MTPTVCYLWYHQGKNRWGITPLMTPHGSDMKTIYRTDVVLSLGGGMAPYTINDAKSYGLPVDHALVCIVDI